jgi:predicted DNA-binding protein with PD1-like motif
MEYTTGSIGRVIVARGMDGEDIYNEIEALAVKENIEAAVVWLVGGMRSGKVVVGPKNPDGPIEPTFREFDDARELAGVGTIFRDADSGKPMLHLHAAIGRGEETIAGCPRGGATVFCVLEAVLLELNDVDARRAMDPELALKLLTLGTLA